jgi:hypothetical protein
MIMRGVFAAFAIGAVLASGCAEGAAQKLELRVVVPCHPGDHAYMLEGTSEGYCLSPQPVFDTSGVVRIQRYPTVPIAVVEISQAASNRLHEVSTDAAAERVGLLFNDRLIYAPMIDAPIKTTTLQLILKNDPEDVDALVAAFPGKSATP